LSLYIKHLGSQILIHLTNQGGVGIDPTRGKDSMKGRNSQANDLMTRGLVLTWSWKVLIWSEASC